LRPRDVKSLVSRPLSNIRAALSKCLALSFVLLVSAASVQSSPTVVLITQPNEHSDWMKQSILACRFYGLAQVTIAIDNSTDEQTALGAMRSSDIVAVIADAKALSRIEEAATRKALTNAGRNTPLLIAAVDAQTPVEFLKNWTSGAVLQSSDHATQTTSTALVFGSNADVTRELTGARIRYRGGNAGWLALSDLHKPQPVISLSEKGRDLPLMVRADNRGQIVFILAEQQANNEALKLNRANVLSNAFPFFIFVRFAAGDGAWHSVGSYANLTIDDAWLTEPYGNLNYKDLLGQMQAHKFHTTIAFVPWNFDRSESNVVSLFKANPDFYSIAVHGNNHDHKEFDEYTKRPLKDQQFDLQQGLARMAKFKALTDLSYDEVMVWPHEVVPPVPTLATLKRYNFLADVNSDVIPQNSSRPADPLFYLRSEQLNFGNFPTIERFTINVPVSQEWLESTVAANAFLGNPLLFYSHHDLFVNGIGSFDGVADFINRTQPKTTWANLGDVAAHLYVVRRRSDGNQDVYAFSSRIKLENVENREVTFFVHKDESFELPLSVTTADGRTLQFERTASGLSFLVAVPPRASGEVRITYSSDINLADVDISKRSWRIAILRHISDFRDRSIATSRVGAGLVDFYNRDLSGLEPEIEKVLASPIAWTVFLLFVIGLYWLQAQRVHRRRAATKLSGHVSS
jgi:hypothetical protein